ncbi:MAG TPA: hypothetical protein VM580_27460 [Labilithrix sp.]|nr:hypothetical protein [Labilithrix sp.]
MAPRGLHTKVVLNSWFAACVVAAASTFVANFGHAAAHEVPSITASSAVAQSRTAPKFVTQFQNRNHRFEATDCGPAAMTSVAKSLGVIGAGESDASAIEHLAAIGQTSDAGTTIDGMGQMARSLRLSFDWAWGTNPRSVAEALRQGKRIVAGGNASSLPWRRGRDVINHYLVIADVTEHGTFVVYDPMDRLPVHRELTADELVAFHETSPLDGVTIAIDRAN